MPALPMVYLETSFISYLTARPSSDPNILAKQLSSSVWWKTCGSKYQLRSSRLVVREASMGDLEAVQERLSLLTAVTLLPISLQAGRLASKFVNERVLPKKAEADALHLAIATAHGV